LTIIAGVITKDKTRFGPALRRTVDLLLPYESLSEGVISAWLPHAQHQDEGWQAHQNINDVMLATALIPDMFLSVGERLPPNLLHYEV
jgi:hypothetical protein